jgi:hypothetical protein
MAARRHLAGADEAVDEVERIPFHVDQAGSPAGGA